VEVEVLLEAIQLVLEALEDREVEVVLEQLLVLEVQERPAKEITVDQVLLMVRLTAPVVVAVVLAQLEEMETLLKLETVELV
jgi:hypothetical protein